MTEALTRQNAMEARRTIMEQSSVQQIQPTTDAAVALQVARALGERPPRNLEHVRDNVVAEFKLCGEAMYYAWRQKDKYSKEPDGKTLIVGISVEGAMVMARHYGLIIIPRLESESRTAWQFSATAVDPETGLVVTRLRLVQKRDESRGGYSDQRALDIAFSDGQRRCVRNVVLDTIPPFIKEQALAAARKAVKADVASSFDEKIGKAIRMFERYNISLSQLEEHLDASKDQWTEEHGLILGDLLRAIKNKETSVEEIFGREPGQEG